LGWPRHTYAHELGASAATHRLGGAPTADWVPRDEFRPHAQESAELQRPPHRLRDVEHHRPPQATMAAADPLYAHAQPSSAQHPDAQPSDAKPSDAQPASCQSQRPSSRLREPYPCLLNPNLVRAPRPSAIRRNARRQPRRPLRCPRQPCQRSTSAAQSCAGHRARELKKVILNTFPTISGCFVLGCQCFVARIYCDGQYFYRATRSVFGNKRGN
jgi:hypothetical protein